MEAAIVIESTSITTTTLQLVDFVSVITTLNNLNYYISIA